MFTETVLYLFATSRAVNANGLSQRIYIELFEACVEYGLVSYVEFCEISRQCAHKFVLPAAQAEVLEQFNSSRKDMDELGELC